jgi:L-ascorbate metabolism protein UlaG (beta-lactamase superfamily)
MVASNHLTLRAAATPPDVANGSVLFIGNATVLIRYAGLTILTDPTFIHRHEQVSIGYGMHSTRLTNPAMEIADLPPLDLILLSHFHRDHFDQVAERDLDKKIPIVTNAEAAKELNALGFNNTFALEMWAPMVVERGEVRLRITSTPGRHGPPLSELVLPDVMGSMLEFFAGSDRALFRLYITGDTLVYDDIREIPKRFPDVDLALLHLGGAHVLGIMVTMDGKQGVEMMRIMEPEMTIPIHYNDYDVFKSPLADFQQEVEAAGLSHRVQYLEHGDSYAFAIQQRR